MGAGILPVALYRGILYLLIGQERHQNKNGEFLWCDFGGSPNKGENTPYKTALREGQEELNGFLGIETDLKDAVDANMILSISYDKYTTYIFNTKYNRELPEYFSNVNKFAEKYFANKIEDNNSGLFEKTTIQWFPVSYFKHPKAKEIIRPHYREIINSIITKESFIIKEIKQINKSSNKD